MSVVTAEASANAAALLLGRERREEREEGGGRREEPLSRDRDHPPLLPSRDGLSNGMYH